MCAHGTENGDQKTGGATCKRRLSASPSSVEHFLSPASQEDRFWCPSCIAGCRPAVSCARSCLLLDRETPVGWRPPSSVLCSSSIHDFSDVFVSSLIAFYNFSMVVVPEFLSVSCSCLAISIISIVSPLRLCLTDISKLTCG